MCGLRSEAIDKFLLSFAAVDILLDESLILFAEFLILGLKTLRLQLPEFLLQLLVRLRLVSLALTEHTVLHYFINYSQGFNQGSTIPYLILINCSYQPVDRLQDCWQEAVLEPSSFLIIFNHRPPMIVSIKMAMCKVLIDYASQIHDMQTQPKNILYQIKTICFKIITKIGLQIIIQKDPIPELIKQYQKSKITITIICWCWCIIYMQSKSALILWQHDMPQSNLFFSSKSQNRLRKSLDNVKNLRIDLCKIRKSFSSTTYSYLENFSPLKKNKSTTILMNKVPFIDKIQAKLRLKNKLENIQKKLQAVKDKNEAQKQPSDVKTIRKNVNEFQMISSIAAKSASLETQTFKQKNRLENQAAAMAKHQMIRPISYKPYSMRNNKYYIAEVVRAINQKNSLAMQHINQSMQMLLQYKLYIINQEAPLEEERIILPIAKGNQNKKTLILDLDQTLIHCYQKNQCASDIKLTINIEGYPFEIGFNIRPYAISFLKNMKKKWEIIVFTASHQSYADSILNQLDPDGILFDHRLYRQHCRELTTDLFIKDLSKLNRDPSRVVLVDNSAYSYAMQLDNGIPILPFYEGKDFQLTTLEHYIQRLVDCSDVRVVNREYFKLYRYNSFDTSSSLVKELYDDEK